MQDVLIIAIVFAVPISAIVAWAKVRLRRIELESGIGAHDNGQRLAALERENADLRARVSVLESIVTLDEHPPTRVRVDTTTSATSDEPTEYVTPSTAKHTAR